MRFIFLSIVLSFAFLSCKEEVQKEFSPESGIKVPGIPSYIGAMPQPEYNLMTPGGIALGKKLFYDPILSKNNEVACASCHIQEKAFADELAISNVGVSGNDLKRNASALFNLAWYEGYFWDGGSGSLELQALGPLKHSDELAKPLDTLIRDLKADTSYQKMFLAAFDTNVIDLRKVCYALAQFERSLLSFNAKYDSVLQGKVAFTAVEEKGKALFEENCSSCHSGHHFTDFGYHNNGLDGDLTFENPETPYWGRFRITLDSADIGKYRTPSLRNVIYTSPYMHDGRFTSLGEVIKHYSSGIHHSKTLDEKLKTNMRFTREETLALIAFLKTLSDENFVTNKKYTDQ